MNRASIIGRRKRRFGKRLGAALTVAVAILIAVLWLAPYVYSETLGWTEPHAIVSPQPVPSRAGAWRAIIG